MAYRRKTRAWSLALCASTILAFSGSGAQAADQFKQAADGASIECAVSARELTRFALIDDQFASVSKISTGTPYNDFAVTNEPLRGDIYRSFPTLRENTPKIPPHQIWLHVEGHGRMRTRITRNPLLFFQFLEKCGS